MAVPNIFGSATSAIPLSQLDQNFATAITLGNTAVYLGNTTTSLGNVTLTNVTISSGNVTVSAGSNTSPSITTVGDTNTGIFFPAAATIAFSEGGVESARIDSAGNMGLGVTPSAWSLKAFELPAGVSLTGNAGISSMYLNTNAIFNAGWTYKTTAEASYYNQQAGAHVWATAASGTAGNAITFTQVLSVDKAKSLALEGATSQTGTGITFPATQSASSNANTLDDYEEGTWTPTIGGNNEGTGGGAGNVYSRQVGTYVKVGKVVTCNCSVLLSTASGNSGVVIFINNWPFTANSTASSLPFVSVSWQGLSSSYVNVMGYLNNNESRLHLVGITAAATTIQTFISPAQLTNTSGFDITFTYITT